MTNDTLTTTAPERIWLQIDPAGAPIDYAEPFPADAEGVTWCRDDVGGVQVEYVRADLAGPAPIGADALPDAVRLPLDSLHADAAYLIGRLRDESLPAAHVVAIIRERIDAAKAAFASAAQPPITYAPPSPTLGVAPYGPGTSAAAPQPPAVAQEPAAWRLTNTAFRKPRFEYHDTKEQAERRQADFNRSVDDGGLHNLTPLYTHPAPAAQGDALDAERLNYLIENRAIVANDPDCAPGYWLEFVTPGVDRWVQVGEYSTPREAIDAARAAKGGGAT